jgi:hypothetical protein
MSMLVARENGQTSKQVVRQPRKEGRCNLDPTKGQPVGFTDACELLLLQSIEFVDQSARGVGAARNKGRRGFHSKSNRRASGSPQEPPDRIPPIAMGRWAIDPACLREALANKRKKRRRGQIDVGDALGHRPPSRIGSGPGLLRYGAGKVPEADVRLIEVIDY